jgi:hypothetical protein
MDRRHQAVGRRQRGIDSKDLGNWFIAGKYGSAGQTNYRRTKYHPTHCPSPLRPRNPADLKAIPIPEIADTS